MDGRGGTWSGRYAIGMEGKGKAGHGRAWHAHDREGGVMGSVGFAGVTEHTKTYYCRDMLISDGNILSRSYFLCLSKMRLEKGEDLGGRGTF